MIGRRVLKQHGEIDGDAGDAGWNRNTKREKIFGIVHPRQQLRSRVNA